MFTLTTRKMQERDSNENLGRSYRTTRTRDKHIQNVAMTDESHSGTGKGLNKDKGETGRTQSKQTLSTLLLVMLVVVVPSHYDILLA